MKYQTLFRTYNKTIENQLWFIAFAVDKRIKDHPDRQSERATQDSFLGIVPTEFDLKFKFTVILYYAIHTIPNISVYLHAIALLNCKSKADLTISPKS